MTEHQAEMIAERRMDRLDIQFLKGSMTQAEYNKAVQEIEQWTQSAKFSQENNYGRSDSTNKEYS